MDKETTIDEYVPDVVELAAWEITAPLLPELTLIYANQNYDSPPLPYATLAIIGRRNIGMPELGEVSEEGIQVYRQVKAGSLSISFYGGTAMKHADNLVSRLSKQTSRDIMRAKRFSTSGQPVIMPLNTRRQGVYIEPGAVVDVDYRYTAKFYDDVGIIERMIANGQMAGKDFELEIELNYIEG